MDATHLDPAHAQTVSSADLLAHEQVVAYAAAARRGDVLPGCLRLSAARAEADWTLRALLIRTVGPVSPQAALDRACTFMPDAPEPRLLRAARSLAAAAATACPSTRRAWLAFAHDDLRTAVHLDPMDATARVLLAELIGPSAWNGHRCAAA